MRWQVGVLAGRNDPTHQSGASLIMEGHSIVIQMIRQTVKVGDCQRFRPELNDAALRFQNDHAKRELLDIRLRVGEPG